MKVESSLDLRYNIAAMCVAILREDIATPEQAFAIISESAYRLTDEDTQDMIKMLEQGMKLEEVGQIYGMTKAGISARISRYKKRTSQTAI
ncbi:hypothetical protein [Tepidimicrobium xylanilyticum]|uniref:Sigma-70, region 4 n=1 Tax=Tepidimicrobium xylanilyticum TaxID=1123352 RepID=A0A1H2YJR3_9FIRM|nr:hypothetical protein [Tepidimicrobium xylanilyticum]SDX05320.1 hypothetical protein SAMN05660923_01640 [Tepidimicrobium xylanilyticum]